MTPINKIFLEITKPLQDEITLESGLVLHKAAEYDVEWSVTTTGKVAAVAPKLRSKVNIEEGSEVAFSFSVISERSFPPDSEVFHPHYENPYLQRFVNGKGEVLQIVAIQGLLTPDWICTLTDAKGEFINGLQAKERDMEKWKSQFSFSADSKFVFKNALDTEDGKTVWQAGVDDIFAKKEGDEIQAVGNRIILKPIIVDMKEKLEIASGERLPYQSICVKLMDRGEAIEDYEGLGIKKGDVVSFQEEFAERYDLWGSDYFILKRGRALGLWVN